MNSAHIKTEIKQMKDYLIKNGAEIPSFWDCVWPGLLMILWIVVCPIIFMQMYIYTSMEEVQAVAGGLGVGVIYAFMVFDVRSKYLAVPKGFRKRSTFFCILSRKFKIHYLVYGVVVAIAAFSTKYTNFPAFLYVVPLLLTFLFSMIVGLLDLNRFGVSAIVSALQLFKSRKQGGE